MLERLADLLRAKDAKAGFEASADMLSITGLSLAQFADLMAGLGYRAEAGEREQRRVVPQLEPAPVAEEAPQRAAAEDVGHTEAVSEPDGGGRAATGLTGEADTGAADTAGEPAPETDTAAPSGGEAAAAETETCYTFTWIPRRQRRPQQGEGAKPRRARGGEKGKGGDRGKAQGGKATAATGDKPRKGKQSPPRERPVDPTNPFAEALAGLKDRL